MLSKQGWKLVIDPSSLVAQIFKDKYYPYSSFLHASLGSNPNYIWQSIWTTQDLIRRNGRLRMGDDSGIRVAQGTWLLDA